MRTGRHHFELWAEKISRYVEFGLADATSRGQSCLYISGWCVFGYFAPDQHDAYDKRQSLQALRCVLPNERVGFLVDMDKRTCEVFINKRSQVRLGPLRTFGGVIWPSCHQGVIFTDLPAEGVFPACGSFYSPDLEVHAAFGLPLPSTAAQ